MSVGSQREVEQKYDVGDETGVPSRRDLLGLPGVVEVLGPVEQVLDATYVDTAGLDLYESGITLRRRSGGDDAGWHLKLPAGKHERQELSLPLGSSDDLVPEELLDLLPRELRTAALEPVVRILTHRTVRHLLGRDGVVLAELCDDRVEAERVHPPGPRTCWREWEVELAEGTPKLLRASGKLLRRGGARPAAAPSKLARALGGATGEVALAYLRTQLTQLHELDPLVRAGVPDSLHKMRVAARRARSVLATYGSLLDPDLTTELRVELRWLGTVLGAARDAEVLQAHLFQVLATRVAGNSEDVGDRIWRELDARAAAGLAGASELMASEWYRRLIDSLDRLVADPPFTDRACRPAVDEVPRLLKRDWDRLLRRVRRAAASQGEARDLALHDVRKAAKRLRYAAESAVPVLGVHARELAASCEAVQDALGEHHDSTVARALLRHVHDEVGPTRSYAVLDRLQAHEEERARAIERDYEAAITELVRPHRGRWLRAGAVRRAPSAR